MKEGKYINKSLFFLTQVINRKASGDSSHIPYRNASLTKILKSSLCGNTKTCVILCLSPSKSQLDHSLQTLKFGLGVGRIETRAERNVSRPSPEETLRVLVQEYQTRLAALGKGVGILGVGCGEEVKAENDMLWQQLMASENASNPERKTLLQFYIEDPSTASVGCLNEPKESSGVVKAFVEALKLSCKHCFYWKSKAQAYEKRCNELAEAVSKQGIAKRGEYLTKLTEVVEDYFKTIKSQAAKLEIYEHTEKWAQQLTGKDLMALATHFRKKLEQIQALTPKAKKPNVAPPKLELKLKHSEQYTTALLKEVKELKQLVPELEEFTLQPLPDITADNSFLNLIQSIKEMLAVASEHRTSPLIKLNKEPQGETLMRESEWPSTPGSRWQRQEVASPNCRAPRTPSRHTPTLGYRNARRRSPLKAETRSKSARPGKVCVEMAKLGSMISQAVEISAATHKESLVEYLKGERYGVGIFSHMHSLKQLKRSMRKQNKEAAGEMANSKSQNEIEKIIPTKIPIHNEARGGENGKVLQSWNGGNLVLK